MFIGTVDADRERHVLSGGGVRVEVEWPEAVPSDTLLSKIEACGVIDSSIVPPRPRKWSEDAFEATYTAPHQGDIEVRVSGQPALAQSVAGDVFQVLDRWLFLHER